MGYVHHIRFHTFIFLINSSIQMMVAMDRQYQFDQAISKFSYDFVDLKYSLIDVFTCQNSGLYRVPILSNLN